MRIAILFPIVLYLFYIPVIVKCESIPDEKVAEVVGKLAKESVDGDKVSECKIDDCKNDGICEKTHKGNRCRCPPGFTGLHCEEPLVEEVSTAGDQTVVVAAAVSASLIVLVLVIILSVFCCFVRQERSKLRERYASALDLRHDVPELEWKRVAGRVLKQRAQCCPCGADDADEVLEAALLLNTVQHHDREYELEDEQISNYSQQVRRPSIKSQASGSKHSSRSAPHPPSPARRNPAASPRRSRGSVRSSQQDLERASHASASPKSGSGRRRSSQPPPLHPTEPPEGPHSDTE